MSVHLSELCVPFRGKEIELPKSDPDICVVKQFCTYNLADRKLFQITRSQWAPVTSKQVCAMTFESNCKDDGRQYCNPNISPDVQIKLIARRSHAGVKALSCVTFGSLL